MPPFNQFTTKAKEVIRKAHELAIERAQNHVNSLHLLTALLIQEDSLIISILDKMDIDTILQSVRKTKRCVIIHEGAKTGGFGAEIASQLMEYAMEDLHAPIQRVTGYDIIMPYFQLEQWYLPSVYRIKLAVLSITE